MKKIRERNYWLIKILPKHLINKVYIVVNSKYFVNLHKKCLRNAVKVDIKDKIFVLDDNSAL
jgi:hypothetical protein